MRCGGIGTRRVSDLSVVFWAAADAGGNRGASVVVAEGSASIISASSSSSSPPPEGCDAGNRDFENPSGRSAVSVMSCISSSLSSLSLEAPVCDVDEEGSVLGLEPFLRWILLRFFLCTFWEASEVDIVETIIEYR